MSLRLQFEGLGGCHQPLVKLKTKEDRARDLQVQSVAQD